MELYDCIFCATASKMVSLLLFAKHVSSISGEMFWGEKQPLHALTIVDVKSGGFA